MPLIQRNDNDDAPKQVVCRAGRRIYFFSDVDMWSVCEAIKLIDRMEFESSKPIEFVIDSAGGYCYHGLALFDRIRQSKCKIYMIATGLVASMGLVVYLAGDYRALTENSRLLNHQSTSDLGGKVSDIKIETQEIFRLEDQISRIIADRTGISPKKIKSQTKVGDDYILPNQAVKQGYAHEIIPNKE